MTDRKKQKEIMHQATFGNRTDWDDPYLLDPTFDDTGDEHPQMPKQNDDDRTF